MSLGVLVGHYPGILMECGQFAGEGEGREGEGGVSGWACLRTVGQRLLPLFLPPHPPPPTPTSPSVPASLHPICPHPTAPDGMGMRLEQGACARQGP